MYFVYDQSSSITSLKFIRERVMIHNKKLAFCEIELILFVIKFFFYMFMFFDYFKYDET